MNNSETAMIQLQFDAKEVNGVITDAMVVMTNLSEVVEEIGASIGKVLPQMLTILEKSQGCLRDIADSTTEIFEKLSELLVISLFIPSPAFILLFDKGFVF